MRQARQLVARAAEPNITFDAVFRPNTKGSTILVFDLLQHFSIHFDEAKHEYRRFGSPLWSVTSVLPYISNDFLDKHPGRIEKAGERGHRVARFIEDIERDPKWNDPNGIISLAEFPPPQPLALSDGPEYHFVRFKRETGFTALASPMGDICSELFVYHDTLDYVGRIDLAGHCPNIYAGPGLIEVKATALLPKTIGPQSAGYFEAFNRCAKLYGFPKLKWRASLHLTAKGYTFELLKDPLDFARFTSILTAQRWARSLGMRLEWVTNNGKPETLASGPEKVFL